MILGNNVGFGAGKEIDNSTAFSLHPKTICHPSPAQTVPTGAKRIFVTTTECFIENEPSQTLIRLEFAPTSQTGNDDDVFRITLNRTAVDEPGFTGARIEGAAVGDTGGDRET